MKPTIGDTFMKSAPHSVEFDLIFALENHTHTHAHILMCTDTCAHIHTLTRISGNFERTEKIYTEVTILAICTSYE